jgi:hypothetical protein
MDWADNMRGIHEMMTEDGGHLAEGASTQNITIIITLPDGEQLEVTSKNATIPQPVPLPMASSSNVNNAPIGDKNKAPATSNNSADNPGADTMPRAVSVADGVGKDDIASRARDYIGKDAEKKVAAIMETLGEDALAYNAIKHHRMQQLTTVDLRSTDILPAEDLGTMTAILDGRFRQVEREISLGQKQTWTFSFNTKMMECIGCREHTNAQPFPRRGCNIRGGRQVIWLADQSMPPCLLVESTQQCVKIIRLESGKLQELAEGLVRTLLGRQIAAGSSVLMTSVTNMAAAGTAGYAEDLLAVEDRIGEGIRGGGGDHQYD